MDGITKGFLALGVGLIALFATFGLSVFLAPVYAPFKPTPTGHDSLTKFHEPTRKMTAIKALGTQRCFIVHNDPTPYRARQLDISEQTYTIAELERMGGAEIAAFCGDALPTLATVVDGREKRDTNAIEAQQAQTRLFNHQRTNGCMKNTLIDCGASVRGAAPASYMCKTGPGEILRSRITCQSATTFTFSSVKRCDECKKTAGTRFMKCLQNFMLGLHLQDECSEPEN